jgi:hypothetical protein
MSWPSSAQGIRPYASPARQAVCGQPPKTRFLLLFFSITCALFLAPSEAEGCTVCTVRNLYSLFSYSYELFCTSAFNNSFAINSFDTLCKKHRGWVLPPLSAFVRFVSSVLCDLCVEIFQRSAPISDDLSFPIMSPRKPFRSNTYGTSCKCSFQKTYSKTKSFRSNTYKKPGGGGYYG